MDPLTSSPSTDPGSPNVTTIPSALVQKLGMRAELVGPNVTVISMPVRGNTQIHGVLHGGATAALCETAASLAASAHIRNTSPPDGRSSLVAVGVQLSLSHLSPARSGKVTARTKAIHLGRTSTVHEVTVADETGRAISVALVTNRIIAGRPQD